jgi:FkbM family methyltransferase
MQYCPHEHLPLSPFPRPPRASHLYPMRAATARAPRSPWRRALLIAAVLAGSIGGRGACAFTASYSDLPSGQVRVNEENASYILEAGSHKIVNWCQTHPGEMRVRRVFSYVLQGGRRCRNSTVVLDIGANFGYYGIWTSLWGCKTFLFDPQPMCHAALRGAIRGNALSNASSIVVPHAVSYPPRLLPTSRTTHCYGQFPMNQLSYMRPKNFTSEALVHAFYSGAYCGPLPPAFSRSTTVHVGDMPALQGTYITLAKIDTEGNELSVLHSLQTHYALGQLGNIVVEVSRREWPNIGISLARGFAQLRTLIDAGYAGVTMHPDDMRLLVSVQEMREYVFRPITHRDQVDIWFSREFSPGEMCSALRAWGACRVGNITDLPAHGTASSVHASDVTTSKTTG